MLLLTLAVFGYTLGIVSASVVIAYRSETFRKICSALFLATWALHLLAVVRHAVTGGTFSVSNAGEFLLIAGLVVQTLHLLLWFRMRFDLAGLVLPPLSAIAAVGALVMLVDPATRETTEPDAWFLFHTGVSTVGMAILSLAFAMSLVYLLKDRALKTRSTLRLLELLPALEKSDRIGFQALLLGFVLLTLGIGTGVMVNSAHHGRLWMPQIKQTFPLLAWMVFAGVLIARITKGVRGKTSAYLTIAGFVLGLLTVWGMMS